MTTKTAQIDPNKLDLENLDPRNISLGTETQDDHLIASTFEQLAHRDTSEASVYAPMTREVQNSKIFSESAAQNLEEYINVEPEASIENLENNPVLEWLKECIPCTLRIDALLDLLPSVELLDILKGALDAQLKILWDLIGLLQNFDIYGDYCALLELLSFMCLPDLQKMISIFMSFLQDGLVPQLSDLSLDMLKGLIVPLFSPILMSMVSILDKFALLVVNPMECIIDNVDMQLAKLDIKIQMESSEGVETVEAGVDSLQTGLDVLKETLEESVEEARNRLNFYLDTIRKLIPEMSGGGGTIPALDKALKKLKYIRLIAFIGAVITALLHGRSPCSKESPKPGAEELDLFFQNYLNPQSSFNMYIDPDGHLHIDEILQPDNSVYNNTELPSVDDVVEIKKQDWTDNLSPDMKNKLDNIVDGATKPISITVPCKLDVDEVDAARVNSWIQNLNGQQI